jgi:alpha-tubulin suppressor-like RCC1 family protein
MLTKNQVLFAKSQSPIHKVLVLLLLHAHFPDFVQVACGEYHTIALTKDSKLFGWGSNDRDQIIPGRGANSFKVPTLIEFSLGAKISRIACSDSFSVAITEKGELFGWGISFPCKGSPNAPVKVELPSKVVDVACGSGHVLIVTEDGMLFGAGRDSDDQIFSSPYPKDFEPVKFMNLPGSPKVMRAFAGGYNSMALTEDGTYFAWGMNQYGNLGLGHWNRVKEPVKFEISVIDSPEKPPKISKLALGWHHSIALLEDGSVYTWGGNGLYQLGLGDRTRRETPCKIDFKESGRERKKIVKGIGTGGFYGYAILSDGSLWMWGNGRTNSEAFQVPTRIKNFRVMVPIDFAEEWLTLFFWLFLGRLDRNSEFCVFPVEVLFHFVLFLCS